MVSLIKLFSSLLSGFGTSIDSNIDKHKNLNRSEILIIDCRSHSEYQSGHINGAILIPYNIIGDKISSVAKNKDQPIALYCRSGSRSSAALRIIQELGYINAVNYGNYYNAEKILNNK